MLLKNRLTFLDFSPVIKDVSPVIQTALSCTLIIHEVSLLNEGIPGIIGVPIKGIVIHFRLK